MLELALTLVLFLTVVLRCFRSGPRLCAVFRHWFSLALFSGRPQGGRASEARD